MVDDGGGVGDEKKFVVVPPGSKDTRDPSQSVFWAVDPEELVRESFEHQN